METRTNKLLDGRLSLHQPVSGYRAAIDPVFLAAATPAQPGMHVLDAGCGVGTAALCLARRVAGLDITGIDIQAPLVELANRNAADNELAVHCRFLAGDINSPPDELRKNDGRFDIVMINPPYLDAGSYSPSPNEIRTTAHADSTARLNDWLKFARRMLRPKGRLVIIHRADHLPQIMAGLAKGFGETAAYPLWPRAGRSAKRVLVGAVCGSKAPARLLPGMVLHQGDDEQAYSDDARNILYNAGGIDLWP